MNPPAMSAAPLLRASSLEYCYHRTNGAGESFRLGPLDLAVTQGEFLTVVGPNGSGKTTLLRVLAGLEEPLKGAVLLNDCDVSVLDPRRRARHIAVVRQQSTPVFPCTVLQFVMLGRYPWGERFGFDSTQDRAAAKAAMEATQVCSLAQRRTDEISGGEMQRVVLARALAQEPQLLLLDEPTANLDLAFQIELLRLLRRLLRDRPLAVVAVMHELNLAAQFADTMLLLHRGKPFALGAPEQVLTRELIEDTYGLPVRVDWNPETGCPQVTVLATAGL